MSLVAAIATTTVPTTTAAAATEAALFLRLRFVDLKSAAAILLAVESGNGRFGFLLIGHLNESETLRAARIAIHDDLSAVHGAMRREKCRKTFIRHVIAEVTNV